MAISYGAAARRRQPQQPGATITTANPEPVATNRVAPIGGLTPQPQLIASEQDQSSIAPPTPGTAGPPPAGSTSSGPSRPPLVPLAGGVPQTGPTVATLPPPIPGANFRRDTFTPGGDPRLQGAQSATDRAGSAVQNAPTFSQAAAAGTDRFRPLFGTGVIQGGPNVATSGSNRYLNEQDSAIAGLSGPSRTELARQAMTDFDTQDVENRTKRYRSLTQNAAGAGRLGMMDEARNILDTERLFNQDRMRFQNELARSVAEGDIGDRFRRVDTVSGLRRGESDIEAGQRAEERFERGYDTDVDIGNEDRRFQRTRSAVDYGGRDADNDLADLYDRYGQAGDLESRIFGQGLSNRGEFRGERDYMNRVEQQDLDNRVRQRELENAELDARVRQAIAQSMAGRG